MHQRTNDFQSLMYLIPSQLAPTSARVEASAYLTDKAIDSDREIDILITELEGICHRRPSPSNAGIESAR
jgi:hypothetical protein